MKHVLIGAFMALFAAVAAADTLAQTATQAHAAFDAWADTHEIATAGFVILHEGDEVGIAREGAFGAGSPAALRLDLGGGADYGLGMFERTVGDQRDVWHFGQWCVLEVVNAGAFAVIWNGEWSAVATYDACVDEDAMKALYAVLAEVIYGL